MKRSIAVAALAVAVLVPGFAQDASSDFDAPAAPADATTAPAIDWGTLKYSGDQDYAYRWAADAGAARTGGFLDSTMKAEYKYHDVKIVAGASVRYNEFVPEETAVFWSPGQFKFGLGLQEFSWGVADKANPTDTLNARDHRYDVDAPRLVNPAASVDYYPVNWMSLEAVYEPWKVESKYPTNFAASAQTSLTESASALNAATATYGNPLASYGPTVTTAASTVGTFNNPVYGGRVNFFLTGLDLSLSYLYDRDAFYTPVVSMQKYGVAGIWVPQTVNLVYNPVQRFGLNVKTTVDRYGFWIETAYNHTTASSWTDDENRHDSIAWTAGMDFNYGPASAYYVNIQYAGVWVMNYNSSALPTTLTAAELQSESYMADYTYQSMTQTLGDQTEQMLNSLMVRMNWPLNGATVTPSLSSVVAVPYNYNSTTETRYASLYLNPEIDVMPVDGLHLLAGSNLAYAWIESAGSSSVTLDTTYDRLGVYTPQNNIYVKVDFKWNGTVGNS